MKYLHQFRHRVGPPLRVRLFEFNYFGENVKIVSLVYPFPS